MLSVSLCTLFAHSHPFELRIFAHGNYSPILPFYPSLARPGLSRRPWPRGCARRRLGGPAGLSPKWVGCHRRHRPPRVLCAALGCRLGPPRRVPLSGEQHLRDPSVFPRGARQARAGTAPERTALGGAQRPLTCGAVVGARDGCPSGRRHVRRHDALHVLEYDFL